VTKYREAESIASSRQRRSYWPVPGRSGRIGRGSGSASGRGG